jgi:predicted ATPase/transcriptional regulator with XRE-family HTH domain
MTYHMLSPSTSPADFGSYLRHLRLRIHLNQRDLAIAVGYSESQISRLEQNQRLPDIDALRARFLPALQLNEEPDVADQLLRLAYAARNTEPNHASELEAADVAAANEWRIAARQSVPTPITSLINREHELQALCALLCDATIRLVTLLGPPGIGKTRLGLQIAATLHDQFRDGIWFVSLAPVRDPDLVLPTIAQVLGMRYVDPIALARALQQRELLLVLDNMEQVHPVAPQIANLLRMVPTLKMLVTSRSPLQITGEQQLVVPPLGLPVMTNELTLSDVAQFPAIRLFVERMRAVRAGFVLTEENMYSIIEICSRLDGLPLAIELAAARGKLFTPQSLLERLRGPSGATALCFLVHGPCDLPDHQRTLRSAIDWSYELLSAEQQLAFVCLAVFTGGCTIESLRAVAAPVVEIDEECIGALVHQSLVVVVEKTGQLRFQMLETMREYGIEKLTANGMLGHVESQYAAYYIALIEEAAAAWHGTQQEHWLAVLEAEHNNLRATLEWLLRHNVVAALQIGVQLRQFWFAHGHLREGRAWLTRMFAHEQLHDTPLALQAALHYTAGYLGYHQGDHQQAAFHSETSLVLWQRLSRPDGAARATLSLAGIAFLQSDYERATLLFHECLTTFEAYDDLLGMAQALRGLAHIAKDQGDFLRAAELHERSLAFYRDVGDMRGMCAAQINLSIVAYWMGNYPRTRDLVEAALPTLKLIGDQMGTAYALELLGMVEYKQRQYGAATTILQRGLELFRHLGDQLGIALILTDLGLVMYASGCPEQACQLHTEALHLALQIGDKRRVAFCFEGLAVVAGAADPLAAARYYGAAAAVRREIGAPLPDAEQAEYQQLLEQVRAGCDPNEWQAAWHAGEADLGRRITS